MKVWTPLAAGLILLAIGSTPAAALEGNGQPFAHYSLESTNTYRGSPLVVDTGADSYPQFLPHTAASGNGDSVLASNGSEGLVQTANSLPAGFSDGTVTYVQNRMVQQWQMLRNRSYLAKSSNNR